MDNEVRTRDLDLGKVALYQLSYVHMNNRYQKYRLFVGDTGFEPVTSSVSGKRATAAPIARCIRPEPETRVFTEVGTGFEPV